MFGMAFVTDNANAFQKSRDARGLVRLGVIALLLAAALLTLTGGGLALAQSVTTDYDSDNDGLIEVNNPAKLNAIRWDMDGDGKVSVDTQARYDAAFPDAATGMGCRAADHDSDSTTPDQPVCTGYELAANLTFDENGDNTIDSKDASYWNAGAGWEPLARVDGTTDGADNIVPLTAMLEGNNHTIDYLYIKRGGFAGLFGRIGALGIVRNLNLTNAKVTGYHYVGALAGSNEGTVRAVAVSGDVSGRGEIGGLVGYNGCGICNTQTAAIIDNSSSSGTVTGPPGSYTKNGLFDASFYVGGLVGQNEHKIEDSSSSTTVIGASHVGGLVGYNASRYSRTGPQKEVLRSPASIKSSHATGMVTATDGKAGGLVGVNERSSIAGSYATGDVEAPTYVGGLVGYNGASSISSSYATGKATGHHAGGLVGHHAGHKVIKDSYATGPVDGKSGIAGGLVGSNGVRIYLATGVPVPSGSAIVASYATGPVRGAEAGGFVGHNAGNIRDSYATGPVNGTSRAGGFSAFNDDGSVRRSYATGPVRGARAGGLTAANDSRATVTDSYWDTTISGQAASSAGTGYTTTQLQSPTGYTGIYAPWDVDADNADGDNNDSTGKDDLWDFGTDGQYPKLKVDFDGDRTATAAEFGNQHENRAPLFLRGPIVKRTVMENTPAGANVGNPVAAVDPFGSGPLAYSLGRTTDDDHFAIAATGQLKTSGALDHEGKSVYTVTVTASDGSLTGSVAVTITVLDVVSEPPVRQAATPQTGLGSAPSFASANATVSVVENTAAGVPIDQPLTATDPDAGDSLTYSLGNTADDDHFAIYSRTGQLKTSGALDHETNPAYSLTVTATDSNGLSASISVTVNVTNRNDEAPAFASDSVTLSVAENSPKGTPIGDPLTAIDPDPGDIIVYWLEDEKGNLSRQHPTFSIDDQGQLTAKGPRSFIDFIAHKKKTIGALDYEVEPSYSLIVFAQDRADRTAKIAVTINVIDVNEAPAFASVRTWVEMAENTAAGTAIGLPVAATDPDAGDSLTYSLGSTTDNAHFAIDSSTGQLKTKGTLDYETDDSYRLTVTATDGDGLSASIRVTMFVTNVNEAPAFASASATVDVAENTAAGASIGLPVAATDPDAGDSLTYSLGSAKDDDHFAIYSRTGQLQTKGALDYETYDSYSVTVTATDDSGLSASIVVTITVADVNELMSRSATPEESAPATAPAAADGPPLIRWEADGQADADTYYRIRRRPDVDDSSYQVIVREMRDDGELDADDRVGRLAYQDNDDALVPGQSYIYGVRAFYGDGSKSRWVEPGQAESGQAEAPKPVTVTVAENTAPGAAIGDPITLASLSGSTALTYTLGNTADDDHFAIDSSSGQLKTKGALDYESTSSYTVTVTATDGDGLTASISVTITVSDVNAAPAFADASTTLNVAENTEAGTAIGNPVTATDPDGDTLAYTLGGADAGHFAIDSSSGQLKTSGVLDYEGQNSYAVTVTVTDGDGLTASIDVTITVDDVADTPPGQPDAPAIINVKETSFRVTWTAPAAGSSAIAGYGIHYKPAAAEDSAYADVKPRPRGTGTGYNLVNRGGQTIAAGTSYDVRVRSKNAEGWGPWSDPASVVTAAPLPVNAAPAFADASTTLNVAENTGAGTAIGNPVTATDPDGDTLAYTLGGADAGHFAIDSSSGQLKTSGVLDYEGQNSYAVTVTAADGDGLTASIDVTITVDDVAEDPKPGNVQAELQSDGSVLVTWDSPTGADDVVFYRVRRCLDPPDTKPKVIARRVEEGDGGAEYLDADSALEAGQSYLYSVRAFDQDGDNIGKWSKKPVKVSIPAGGGG